MLKPCRLLAALFMLLVSKEGFSEPEINQSGQFHFHLPHPVSLYIPLADTIPFATRKTPWLVERFRLRAGLFVPVNNTQVQVSAFNRDIGTNIDFENDLGFSRVVSTFMANFAWRVSPRSRINASYYNIARSSTYTLKKDIVFDSTTYFANTSVTAFFNTPIFQLSYGYAILAKPNYEVGLQIGAHIVGFSTGMSVRGTGSGFDKSSDFEFTAPLPDLGIWGSYVLSNRFALNLEVGYLALTIDDTNGRILSYDFQFLYKLLRRLDVSLGFTGLNFKVTKTTQYTEGIFMWGYNGPSLSLSYSFGKNNWNHSTSFDER
jgi:hypothetical protein